MQTPLERRRAVALRRLDSNRYRREAQRLQDGCRLCECAYDQLDRLRRQPDESWCHENPVYERTSWIAKNVDEFNLMPIR
jgi:hypothetical protein